MFIVFSAGGVCVWGKVVVLWGRGKPDIVCTDGTYPDQPSERALPLSLWGNLKAKLPDSGKFLGLECST